MSTYRQEEFSKYPFNLATQGRRQPGSAFKPFTLAVALQSGFGPDTLIASSPWDYPFIDYKGLREIFKIRNFANAYSGIISLAGATAYSDNSAYARLGLLYLKHHGGIARIKHTAQTLGIRTPISTNPAMILGGLTIGVSPLDMAHAYETIAQGGCKVFDPILGAPHHGPTGIASITGFGLNLVDSAPGYRQCKRELPVAVAKTEASLLTGPVNYGTAHAALVIMGGLREGDRALIFRTDRISRGRLLRDGLDTPVRDSSTVILLPAMAGGCGR